MKNDAHVYFDPIITLSFGQLVSFNSTTLFVETSGKIGHILVVDVRFVFCEL